MAASSAVYDLICTTSIVKETRQCEPIWFHKTVYRWGLGSENTSDYIKLSVERHCSENPSDLHKIVYRYGLCCEDPSGDIKLSIEGD